LLGVEPLEEGVRVRDGCRRPGGGGSGDWGDVHGGGDQDGEGHRGGSPSFVAGVLHVPGGIDIFAVVGPADDAVLGGGPGGLDEANGRVGSKGGKIECLCRQSVSTIIVLQL